MSYIDTFAHEVVGHFIGVPVYHPLEPVEGWAEAPEDFACDPSQLVIGGGTGEHPGLVIRSPSAAVAQFAKADAERSLHHEPERQGAWRAAVDVHPPEGAVHYAGWSDETHRWFRERCSGDFLLSPWYDDAEGRACETFEIWLLRSVGEFVFFAMPELAPAIMTSLPGADDYYRLPHHTMFNNIALPLPSRNMAPKRRAEAERGFGSSGVTAWDVGLARPDMFGRALH